MLVRADTLDDLRTIAGLAAGLSILPASVSDIAQALGITHCPVLISAHGNRTVRACPVAALLRPLVELWSTLVAFAAK